MQSFYVDSNAWLPAYTSQGVSQLIFLPQIGGGVESWDEDGNQPSLEMAEKLKDN